MESKNKIGIIGLGYVGLPLAIQFSKKKISVLGFDTDNEKLSILRKGKSYINHIKDSDIKKFTGKNFIVSSDFTKIKQVKNIILCLPTPIKKIKNLN